MIRQVLGRMGDYVVDMDNLVTYPDQGTNAGFHSIPVTFTPGERLLGDTPLFGEHYTKTARERSPVGSGLDPDSATWWWSGAGWPRSGCAPRCDARSSAARSRCSPPSTAPPYDRPPLSKDVLLGKRDDTTLAFDTEKLGVEVRTGTRAVGLSTADRLVHLQDGSVGYDALAIATGASPVRLPGNGRQLTLRTLDDALALRRELRPGARVVVIGASWIGAEVCTAALAAGCRVTCVEFQTRAVRRRPGRRRSESLTRAWWRRRRPAHERRGLLRGGQRRAPGRRRGPLRPTWCSRAWASDPT